MHELTFLQDMAIVMIVSAIVTILCHQFRLPIVLGYIVAGVIIGPYTPPPFPFVTDLRNVHTLSELGIIFLLFGIGLEFSLTKMMRVGLEAFIAATLEIMLMLFIGFSLGKVFGWNRMDSLFLGAILAISSTTIIAKILIDTKKIQERYAQIILGILIIEDLLAIIIIAVLSGLAFQGELNIAATIKDLIKVGGFISGVLLIGSFLVPRLLTYIRTFQSSEMMIITVLGLCFGTSLIAAKLGLSVALGAFLIGAIVAETKQLKFITRHFESVRDMFTAIFFVSVGLLIDPKMIMQYATPILIITLVTIVGKVFSCSLATFISGDKPATAFKVGLGLAQIGEFSFIIAQLGESSNVTSNFIFPIAVAVSSLTTLSTPFLMKYADPIVEFAGRWTPNKIIHWGKAYSEKVNHLRKNRIEADTQNKGHDSVRILQEDHLWGLETQDFLLPYKECAINQSVKDLALRTYTGAIIVAIYRYDETITNPHPDMVLEPGDVILVMGSKEQLEKGFKFLNNLIKGNKTDKRTQENS